MPGSLTSIPDAQDIGGLLRRWSPIVIMIGPYTGYKSAIADLDRLAIVTAEGTEEQESVALDLTDPTGRAHAAWWTLQTHTPPSGWTGFVAPISVDEAEARRLAWMGLDMTRAQIDTLARLVLRLAGRVSLATASPR